MKKLKYIIALFCILISLPLTFVIWRTYRGLEREERAQMRFFAETLFDQMEKELSDLVQQEEGRGVDEYGHFFADAAGGGRGTALSPLARDDYREYIQGYLQNNPDGSFQTPLVADMGKVPVAMRRRISELREVNLLFNSKKFLVSSSPVVPLMKDLKKGGIQVEESHLSERYLKKTKQKTPSAYLGRKTQRVEEITLQQAYNIAGREDGLRLNKTGKKAQLKSPGQSAKIRDLDAAVGQADTRLYRHLEKAEDKKEANSTTGKPAGQRFQVEVAPFQSVVIDGSRVFVFRRIGIDNQIYRQGFVVLVKPLMQHLAGQYFENQPLAGFSSLLMQKKEQGSVKTLVRSGVHLSGVGFSIKRTFPPPFGFLAVTLEAETIPSSPARRSLSLAIGLLGLFTLMGLIAIYQSVRSIVAMSERRSQFVSSVTHELKTPLTNIRMYVEMLEQGIAATAEKEQEYLGILSSESARLAGLINNVLELAKLEKNTRRFHMQPGVLDDVLMEVGGIFREKLERNGFNLIIEKGDIPEFSYDREVLIQVLLNLIENSIKFGREQEKKTISIKADCIKQKVRIRVSDTGPGISRHALNKVFDDFYRIDNDLTRKTGGTGIGLALVKKFIVAMGGVVEAANNEEEGCTITILLPVSTGQDK